MPVRDRLLRIANIVVVALLSLSAVSAQTPARESQRADRGLIWKVERDGRTGWLVGSLHLLTPDFYPLPATMTDAFARAEVLMEEIDLDEASDPKFAALVLSKAMYPTGTTLASQLSPETSTKLAAALAKVGLTIEVVQQLKPWMVALTLETLTLQRLGFDPALGIDKYFDDAASKAGTSFQALETAAEQINFLDGLSPRMQDLMLRESVDSPDGDLGQIKALASAWRAGDAAGVERLALSSAKDMPEVYQSLIADRNRRWVPKIETCVQARRCFVVVGAAHLVGPDGLVEQLKQRGYTVSQQ